MAAPLVRCDEVAKRFGRGAPLVLSGVSLEVAPGQAVHVSGANGTGKTTLLRLLAGVTRPTAGVVECSAGSVGWAPAEPIGGSALNARGLLAAAVRVQGATAGALDDVVMRLGLDGHTAQHLRTRSAGTRRKVNVAFALAATDPALLVLDEPWAGLDALSGAVLTSVIEERCRAGSCVVFTDHGHAATLPEKVLAVEMRDGGLRSTTTEAPSLRVDANRGGQRRLVVVAPAELRSTIENLLDEGWSVTGVERP